MTAASVRATAGCSGRARPSAARPAADRERQPALVDDSDTVLGQHRGSQLVDSVGVFAPAWRTSKASASRARTSVPAGASIRRWMGSMQSSSSASSTTNVMIAVAHLPARCRTRAQLVAVVDGRLEPVVPISQHERSAPDRRADRGDALGVVDRGELVVHALRIDALGQGSGLLHQRGEPGAERQSPDRVDVDAHRPQQRETIRLRFRAACARGEDVVVAGLGQGQGAEDAPGVAARAVRIGELHPVGVQARLGVADRAHLRRTSGRRWRRPGRSDRLRPPRPAAG